MKHRPSALVHSQAVTHKGAFSPVVVRNSHCSLDDVRIPCHRPFGVEADLISVPGLIRVRLRCAQNVRRSMLFIHCTDPFEHLLVRLSVFSSSPALRQVRRFSERKRQACGTCSKLVASNLPRTASRLRGAHASSGRSSSPRLLCKGALLRLKAVLWRGLCHGQQKCRLCPPVGRAHLDSEEGKDQAKETHESSWRCQERVQHRPSLALSRSVGTFGAPNFERPLVARAFPQARL